MCELADVKLLVLSRQPALATQWAGMLGPADAEIWTDPASMPSDRLPDVVVSDGRPFEPNDGKPNGAPPAAVGLIRIGPAEDSAPPPDVRLPDDVTARELRVACRLLAEVVQLRRREQNEAALRHQLTEAALTDPLTGLPNRRAWDQAVLRHLAAVAKSCGPAARRLCLAVFDLDHFKQINDQLGHSVGDAVLRSAGRALSRGLRQTDFVARLGGDEFGLLLWVPDHRTAHVVIDRVRESLPSHLAHTATQPATASAGFCLVPAVANDESPPYADVLFAAADAAMREAKRQGRDRTVQA
ncbi:MAG: GGDEF domain-containing protein [Pirellulales bacterium]|nr:GGDEF domain-containing protein [Pirellulales bacterium]